MCVWLRFRKPSLVSHLVNDRAGYFGKIACFEEEHVAGTTPAFPYHDNNSETRQQS